MTWKHVAKKDFEDAIRSKALWVVLFIFVVFAAGGSYALTFLPTETGLRGEVLTSDTAIIALNSVASWLVPIIGLMLGYGAVVGERESGSLKILL
ncbi:MAG: ABC transporter permease subunit, partial [Halobacteria archaeon]|nr:ABC transporter permease subunit [Halobacteria archaeon]